MFKKIKKDIIPPEYILPENVPLGEVKYITDGQFIKDERFIYNGYMYKYHHNAISTLSSFLGFNDGKHAYIRGEKYNTYK